MEDFLKQYGKYWWVALIVALIFGIQSGFINPNPNATPTEPPPPTATLAPGETPAPTVAVEPSAVASATVAPEPYDDLIYNGKMNPPYVKYDFSDFDYSGEETQLLTVEVADGFTPYFKAPPSMPELYPAWERENGEIVYLAIPEFRREDCEVPSPNNPCFVNSPPAQKFFATWKPYIAGIYQQDVPTIEDYECTLTAFIGTRHSEDDNQGNKTDTLRDQQASKWTLGVLIDNGHLPLLEYRLEPRDASGELKPFGLGYRDGYGNGHYSDLTLISFTFIGTGNPVTVFIENQRGTTELQYNDSIVDDVTMICRPPISSFPNAHQRGGH
jgi:hypothetical protein